jgi:hypothetical protein
MFCLFFLYVLAEIDAGELWWIGSIQLLSGEKTNKRENSAKTFHEAWQHCFQRQVATAAQR